MEKNDTTISLIDPYRQNGSGMISNARIYIENHLILRHRGAAIMLLDKHKMIFETPRDDDTYPGFFITTNPTNYNAVKQCLNELIEASVKQKEIDDIEYEQVEQQLEELNTALKEFIKEI